MISFEGRVAIITGAGNGLGRSYALELARRGARVVVNDLGCSGSGQGESKDVADQVVDEIKAAGGSAVPNYDSVSTRAGGDSIVKSAMDAWGRVDIVINNAGFLRNARFEDLSDEQIDAMLDVHLNGAFYVSQPAYCVMKAQQYGRFLFTSSASAMYGSPWQANYCAAKGGLMGLSNAVALEGQRHGILSNALMPTAASRLAAEIDDSWMAEVTHVAEIAAQVDFECLGPLLTVDSNMPLAVYLVSEQSQATHGIYSAVGGRYARVFVGAADGWAKPGRSLASVEDVAAHWSEIEDRSRYHLPKSVYEEFLPAVERIKAAG